MLFSIAFIYNLLLASAVLAHRRHEHPRTGFLNRIEKSNNVAVQYSNSSAGSVVYGTDLANVTGTLTLPTTLNGDADSSVCAVIGIGHDVGCNCTLQLGMVFTLTQDGPEYKAYYVWQGPAGRSGNWLDITFSPGDDVALSIEAASGTTATITVENVDSNQSVSQTINSLEGLSPTCMGRALWLIGKYYQFPLVNFSHLEFKNANALGDGNLYYPANGVFRDLVQDNQTMATVSSPDGFSIDIQYVG